MSETIQSLEAKNKANDLLTMNLQEKVHETSSCCHELIIIFWIYILLYVTVSRKQYIAMYCYD
jgi:hypothetical protein